MPRCADALKVSLGSRTRDTKIGRGALFLLWDRTQRTRADAPQVRSQIWTIMLRWVMGSSMLACKSWRPQQMFGRRCSWRKCRPRARMRNGAWAGVQPRSRGTGSFAMSWDRTLNAALGSPPFGSRTHWGWMNPSGAAIVVLGQWLRTAKKVTTRRKRFESQLTMYQT